MYAHIFYSTISRSGCLISFPSPNSSSLSPRVHLWALVCMCTCRSKLDVSSVLKLEYDSSFTPV